MSKVVDEELAMSSPCKCYVFAEPRTKAANRLCYVKGCKGMLTDEQEEKYCFSEGHKSTVFMRPSAKWQRMWDTFKVMKKAKGVV